MKSTLAFNSFIALNLSLMTVFVTPQLSWSQIKDPQTEQRVLELKRQFIDLQGKKEFEQQLKITQEGLDIARENNDKSLEALALQAMGLTYCQMDNPQLCLKYSMLALSMHRQINEQEEESTDLQNIGYAHARMSEHAEALKYYQEAYTIGKRLDNTDTQAIALNNIAATYGKQGKPQQAIDTLKQALLIFEEKGENQIKKAITLSNIGTILSDIGKSQEAIESLNSALKIFQRAGIRQQEATTLLSLGAVYFEINRTDIALEHFNQSLSIFKEINYKFGEATAYNNIAMVYKHQQYFQKAIDHFNLAISTYPNDFDVSFESTVSNNIAGILTTQKKYDEAIQQYLKSLNLSIKIGDSQSEIIGLNNLAFIYGITNQAEKALDYHQRALVLSQKTGYFRSEATITGNIGTFYKTQKRLPEAIQWWDKSLMQKLILRRELKRENRTAFTEDEEYKGTATALIDVLIDTQQSKRAYEWSNLVNTAELADYTRLLNAKVANPKAQTAIDLWNQSNSQLGEIRKQLKEKYAPMVAQRMREKEAQVNQQAEAITAQFPEIAELFETKLSDIAKLQASLPIGTTVLHPVRLDGFPTTPRNVALFVITQNSLTVTKVPVQEKELDQLISETYGRITNRKSSTYRQNLATLYNLLIKPIESEIVNQKTKQLSIIATGQLRYIPFESLYDQATSQYLIEKYPINYLTRLSVNSFDKSPTAKLGANFKILALGNPVTKEPLNLPGALAEVNAIVPLFPGSQSLTGHNATLNEFKIQSPQFQILHLATHGCFQSGGCPRLGLKENTILFADRQFNIADAALLGLKNTELVTLTACQSALNSLKLDDRGQLALDGGTELSGLAYLLERAGAKAVIPTLWSVEDESTQAISVSFYSNLKQGMNKSEALRQAKLRHIDKHPFFWAPLILIGDPR
jgi:CHAT domain-containing protein